MNPVKYALLLSILLVSLGVSAQTTPNLGLTLPVQGSQAWGTVVNGNFTIIDTFAGTAAAFPSSGTGILFGLTPKTSRFSTSADIIGLFGSGACSGFLKSDGTCQNMTGGLTSFTTGNLTPLFTATLGGSPTTTPALAFTLSNAGANTVFGNFTGSAAAPTFSSAPIFSAASLTNFPTLNQSTTGNAATATALAATPTLCTVSGQFPKGILANGNSTGCAAPPTSGITSIGLATPAYFTVSGSPLTTNGTMTISATTGLTANSFLATPDGTTGALGIRILVPGDLPISTVSTLGAVTPDGSTIAISGGGVISLALGHANTWTATQTLSGLALSAITGSTQCLQTNTSGVVSGAGVACGAIHTTASVTAPANGACSTVTATFSSSISSGGTVVASQQSGGVAAWGGAITARITGTTTADLTVCSIVAGAGGTLLLNVSAQ